MGFMRTNDLCGCGCGGYCSIFGMLRVCAWQLETMADGLVPEVRHDGSAWSDAHRPADAGGELGFHAVLLYLKGDWAEFTKSMGLSGWKSNYHCCPICPVESEAMHWVEPGWLTEEGMMMADRGFDDYETDCKKCECRVLVDTPAKQTLIADQLKPVEKEGIILKSDIPALGLKAGDRLEASAELMVPLDFRLATTPFSCVFWRRRCDAKKRCIDSVSHRCPLFSEKIHSSPARNLCFDTLHTVNLGIMQRWLSAVLHRILHANIWGAGVGDAGVRRLESDLISYYGRAGVPHSRRVNVLTPKMLGDPGDGAEHSGAPLKLKASETYTVFKYALDRLVAFRHHGIHECENLIQAGSALGQWKETVHKASAKLSRSEFQSMIDNASRFVVYSEKAGIHFTPKFHGFGHLTARRCFAFRFWGGRGQSGSACRARFECIRASANAGGHARIIVLHGTHARCHQGV